MRITASAMAILAGVLLAGCAMQQLDNAGQQVRLAEEKPGAQCQFLGNISAGHSNWLSGNNESGSLRAAANALRNKAAAMGGNVLYNVNSPTESLWSAFVPVASKMSGDVYRCP